MNLMGPPSYMRSVVDRNVVMRCIPCTKNVSLLFQVFFNVIGNGSTPSYDRHLISARSGIFLLATWCSNSFLVYSYRGVISCETKHRFLMKLRTPALGFRSQLLIVSGVRAMFYGPVTCKSHCLQLTTAEAVKFMQAEERAKARTEFDACLTVHR